MSDVQISGAGGPATLQPTSTEQYFADVGVNIKRCQVVCFSASPDKVKLAEANAFATSLGLGLATQAAGPGAMLWAKYAGIIEASAAQWDAVIDGGGPLVGGEAYYLSAANPGNITAVAPTGGGDLVVLVGVAVSATSLNVTIGTPASPPSPIIP
jgi:hypothetical protein